jgi:hypothetical protein
MQLGFISSAFLSKKFAASIPDDVTGLFRRHNPSGRTMTLGSTQPLTEMSTRNIFWGKGGRCLGMTTLLPSCTDCLKIWETQPPRSLRAYNGIALPLPSSAILTVNFIHFLSCVAFYIPCPCQPNDT